MQIISLQSAAQAQPRLVSVWGAGMFALDQWAAVVSRSGIKRIKYWGLVHVHVQCTYSLSSLVVVLLRSFSFSLFQATLKLYSPHAM